MAACFPFLQARCNGASRFLLITPSAAEDPILTSLAIFMGGRSATADATGDETSGVVTIKDSAIGAQFFWKGLQGKVE